MAGTVVKGGYPIARLRAARAGSSTFQSKAADPDPLPPHVLTASDLIAMARFARKAQGDREEKVEPVR